MADKFYLIKASEVTAEMRSLARNDVDAVYFKVLSDDVSEFAEMLPTNSRFYMSSDIITKVAGEQVNGIFLPEKVVTG